MSFDRIRRRFTRMSTLVAASASVLLMAACGESSSPASLPVDGSVVPGGPQAADERDCLWVLNSKALNIMLPDTYAYYWLAVLPIPPGGHVQFDGMYPHARYMSFNLYNPLLQPIDALADYEIAPAVGSENPFLPGADRQPPERSFSVRVVAGAAPASGPREPNTLYSAQPLGPVQLPTNLAVVLYRTYVPDAGRDAAGGTGLPRISFVSANGTKLSGLQACSEPSVLEAVLPDLGNLPDPISDIPINTAAYPDLLWLQFYNLQAAQASRVFNTPLGPAVYELIGSPESGGGGFLSNRDNRYIYAAMSQLLGELVVVHAKFPTTPKTTAGNATMGEGDMRYWSLCTENANTTAAYSCLYDEQLVRDSQGRGVIVVSKPEDRPANATAACGVTWLDWGIGDTSLLLLRNMLPLSKQQFPYAIQYIEGAPGQREAEVMGPYYPYARHLMRNAFEALGCPVSADDFPSVVTPPPGAARQ